jgi:FKBP-type peptidyl-prolyl cis-trans isomerase SlyD
MQAAKDTVVHISYVLKDGKGATLDESSADDSFVYLHGHENIVPGLEKALDGKGVGDRISVSLTPDQGYGDYDPALVRKIPKSEFPARMRNPKPGQMLQIEEEGRWRVWRVDGVDATHITIDGNHELAGQDLHFDVEVHGVRPATPEELEHGHAHAPGHHHH